MHYFTTYTSPLGEILLASDDEGLTHLAFDGQKYFPALTNAQKMPSHPILISAQRWLDSYFAGENPELTPPLHASGSNFQRAVWQLLLAIPYGETTTYGAIAQEIARLQQRSRMSAQAVGGAVGHNPIGIIVPCHRVVGASGSLTGYAGGLDKKIARGNVPFLRAKERHSLVSKKRSATNRLLSVSTYSFTCVLTYTLTYVFSV